ncbi:MAG TPA: hypothetical protein VHQ47_01675 [Phycisphaerae bacterium]|jgi:hypothetical protein|nr:hypothetical protein [Phycisphaerae bacterium]
MAKSTPSNSSTPSKEIPPKTFRVTGLEPFHRAPGIPGLKDSWLPLQVGDTVYLFLAPNGSVGYTKFRYAHADFTVLESGARLLANNTVYSFSQWGITRDQLRTFGGADGFVAMTPNTFPGAPLPTQKTFEDDLHKALAHAPAIAKLLAEPDSPTTAPAQ